ncbi:HAMP domain-containing histidine kinase [Plantactinospora sp. S1510]|uniref:histidine kinase n=2 Tax=Plantactinospora alkalitolerans TaxID=2789879 RepID=A0ABS0GZ87_9ACTN|nr:HAMP domain-containing histidine kinase [Plantactinospora alkalitolerans]
MYGLMARHMAPGRQLAEAGSGADRVGQPAPLAGFAERIRESTLEAMLIQGGVALVVIIALAVGLGWLIAGRMLRPLHRVTDTARRIAQAPAADRRLDERIALDGPHDEIRVLADTFDVMLERLDSSFDGQRRFIANASHELRTPLTLNRALLEVAVYRRTASEEVRQLGETLLEINRRHERLIDGLLVLARSERQLVDRSFVDLADLAQYVVFHQAPHELTIDIEAAEAPTIGNSVLLERLVRNLVENAVHYNVKDGWVSLRTYTDQDGSAVLEVTNTGPDVPPFEVPSLFEPFHRSEGVRAADGPPGSGLGLSIVRAVAHAHDGTASAEPRGEGGLIVTIRLPGAKADG